MLGKNIYDNNLIYYAKLLDNKFTEKYIDGVYRLLESLIVTERTPYPKLPKSIPPLSWGLIYSPWLFMA